MILTTSNESGRKSSPPTISKDTIAINFSTAMVHRVWSTLDFGESDVSISSWIKARVDYGSTSSSIFYVTRASI